MSLPRLFPAAGWLPFLGIVALLAACGQSPPAPPPTAAAESSPADEAELAERDKSPRPKPPGKRPPPHAMEGRPDRMERLGRLDRPRRADGKPREGREGRGKPGQSASREDRERMMYMRQRLNRLASLPEKQLQKALDQWPPYQEMKPPERQKLRERIKRLQERRRHAALKFAEDEGIEVTIRDEQEFINAYWDAKLESDKRMMRQIRELRERSQTRLVRELKDEFGEENGKKDAAAGKKKAPES
ncbi:MAG: hypothetical protein AAGK14_10420 [Verrucomicrobiota bacterium]